MIDEKQLSHSMNINPNENESKLTNSYRNFFNNNNNNLSLMNDKTSSKNIFKKFEIYNTNTNKNNSTLLDGISSGAGTPMRQLGNIYSVSDDLNKRFSKPQNISFDCTTLFLLKNNLNYMYDMYLTLNTFQSLKMCKINKCQTNINFENFVNYMINYFYPISKIKNYKIEVKSDLEGEVYAIYDYYRVIFFNIIIFILNNSRDLSKEKTLTISVKHHIFTENQGSYYKAIFSFKDESPYIPYNLLNELLNSLKNTEINKINLENYKMIDFGLLVSFYIANTVYNSEFMINTMPNTHNHMIIVNILASNTSNAKDISHEEEVKLQEPNIQTNSVKSNIASKIFKKPKTYIEETYYNKILLKMYKDNTKNKSESFSLCQKTSNNVNDSNKKLKKKFTTESLTTVGLNSLNFANKLQNNKSKPIGLYDDGTNDGCNFFLKFF